MTSRDYSRFKPKRTRAKYLIGAPPEVYEIRDSGPNKGADRYTVIYGGPRFWNDNYAEYYWRQNKPRMRQGRAMSSNPRSPVGIGLFIDCEAGRHLGKLIAWADLPEQCQSVVLDDVAPEEDEGQDDTGSTPEQEPDQPAA